MEKIKIPILSYFLIVLFAAQASLFSSQKTWNGNVSSSWDNPSNWTPNGVPNNADIVTLPSDPAGGRFPIIYSGIFEANMLYVNAGASATIHDGQLTIVSGTNFVLESGVPGGTFTQTGGTLILRDFIIGAGAEFTQSGGIIKISRNWINSGTFSSINGTVNFISNSGSSANFEAGINQLCNIIIDQSVEPGFDKVPGSKIYVNGNFENNNTSLSINANASFIFNGTQNRTIQSNTSGSTFGNLSISKTASTAALLSNINVSGDCNIIQGTLNIGPHILNRTIAGGLISINSNAELMIGGTNSFPANFSIHNIGSKAIVEYNGSDQAISNELFGTLKLCGTGKATLPMGLSSLNHLYMNSPLGISLTSSLTVNDSLTLVNGNVILGPYTLTAGGSAVISAFSSSSYIVADETGYLRINNVGSIPKVFPVGLAASYNPVTIINYGTADNFSVKVKDTFDNPPTDSSKVVKKQWTINEEIPGGSNAIISLQFNSGEWNSGFNITKPVNIGRWNGSNWVGYYALVSGSQTYVATALEPIFSFSPFGVGNEGSLPVEIAYFNSTINNRNVILKWGTVNEINNSGFVVEKRSEKENVWANIGCVNGYGTTNEPKNYLFEDKKLNTGIYFYRIRQVDYNGNYEYFNLVNSVTISPPADFFLSQNYPNPSNPNTRIDFSLPFTSDAKLVVYDAAGKLIITLVNEKLDKGYYTFDFNGTNYASGIYFYRIEARGFEQTKRFVLIK
ncbi:MAG TPA: T9SS type A sorting domain-containing protein [Ignavibacteria bacterium]|jgi:hypothetical protein